jgi:hypothetical protein
MLSGSWQLVCAYPTFSLITKGERFFGVLAVKQGAYSHDGHNLDRAA